MYVLLNVDKEVLQLIKEEMGDLICWTSEEVKSEKPNLRQKIKKIRKKQEHVEVPVSVHHQWKDPEDELLDKMVSIGPVVHDQGLKEIKLGGSKQ